MIDGHVSNVSCCKSHRFPYSTREGGESGGLRFGTYLEADWSIMDYHHGCAKILTDHGTRSSGQVQKWARSPWRSRLRPAELEEFATQVDPSR